jgi:hypothetical protein
MKHTTEGMDRFRKEMRDAAWVEHLIVVIFGAAYAAVLYFFL